MAAENLQTAKLVARTGYRHRFVQGESTHHLELTQHRGAVKRDGGTDTWNDRVERIQFLAFVVNAGIVRGYADRARTRGPSLFR